jgi:uncharacterized protein (TIGR02001 family)
MGHWAGASWRLGACTAFALLAAPAAIAAVEVRYEATLLSQYVWRGITLTDGPVLQPSVTISHDGGLSFEVWGNVDLADENDTPWEVNEARLVLDYRRRIGGVDLGAGLIEYLFPNTPFPGTREAYLRFGIEAIVAPELELYYDFDEIDGAYARLAFTYVRELNASWRFALVASVGYADAAFAIGGRAGFHDGGVEARLERSAGAFVFGLRAGWTDALDAEVLPEQPTSAWGGVSLGYRF